MRDMEKAPDALLTAHCLLRAHFWSTFRVPETCYYASSSLSPKTAESEIERRAAEGIEVKLVDLFAKNVVQ